MSWGCWASAVAGGAASPGVAGFWAAAGAFGNCLGCGCAFGAGCAAGGACANAVEPTVIAVSVVVSANANARAPGRAGPDAIRTFMTESFCSPPSQPAGPARTGVQFSGCVGTKYGRSVTPADPLLP